MRTHTRSAQPALSRRTLLTAAAGTLIAPGVGLAQSPPKHGGRLLVGSAGGGAKDKLDPHAPVSNPDIARVFALYEPLAERDQNYAFKMVLAEEISGNATADVWTVRLREGVEFHNGKTLTADDAIASIRRMIDPKRSSASSSLADIDPQGMKKLDDRTFTIQLKQPYGTFDVQLGQYGNGIVPADFDLQKPVGTGPFKMGSLTPGDRSSFPAHKNYWRSGQPYVDELVIIDFPDETARINALMSGQVHAIDNVPFAQARPLGVAPGLQVLQAKTGAWLPFTMRVDQAPFDDVRVRQAMRLLVDRPQMVEQALSGLGSIANDLYSPFDPAYAADLSQRHQDFDQAKSLLKAAGHANLEVELVTAPVAAGVVEAAQVLVEQARGAGVKINIRKVDTGVFYGSDYLKWPFAQDFWYTRDYLPQTAVCALPGAIYNETHFSDPKFAALIADARRTLDAGKRQEILHQAQRIEYATGGYIIWGFRDQIDAYSAKIAGFIPSKTGTPLGNYGFGAVHFL